MAIQTDLTNTALASVETMAYQLTFTAAPKRIYKVHFLAYLVDAGSEGDGTASVYPVKNAAIVRGRWAPGASASDGTVFGAYRVAVFDDDATAAQGCDCTFYLTNPPAGQTTVGISIAPSRPATTYGPVAFQPSIGSHLVVEDVGPYSD
ncbi:hypothetical protein [Streptomyces sp. NPDC048057]|uniref:DUF7298 domain-containing protein n=1 Tax=Streptomyces sp. NPDC048057 TaxID=3155628 RepID=UPI0033E8146F